MSSSPATAACCAAARSSCGAYVYSDNPDEQLRDVLSRFAPHLAPWTRCTACNGPLREADKDSVGDRLQHGTQRSYDVFAQCTDCERVYWRGAHHARLERIVSEAVAEFGPGDKGRGDGDGDAAA